MTGNHTTFTSRHAAHPEAVRRMDTAELRSNFHVDGLFVPDRINLTYTHYDRMIVGGAMPVSETLALDAIAPTGTKNFLDRREIIAVNIGGPGIVTTGEKNWQIGTRDMVYVGMGEQISFASADASNPAKFYLLSAPAHQSHPTKHIRIEDAKRLDLGSAATSNERSI